VLLAPGTPVRARLPSGHCLLGITADPVIIRTGQKPNGPSGHGFFQPTSEVQLLTVQSGGTS